MGRNRQGPANCFDIEAPLVREVRRWIKRSVMLKTQGALSPHLLEQQLRKHYPHIKWVTTVLGDNHFLVELPPQKKYLKEGRLSLDQGEVEVLHPMGPLIDAGKPLNHYWVLVLGLPLQLRHPEYVQSLIDSVGDVIEVDWLYKEWLDNRWLRVKLALPDLGFLPDPKTCFLKKNGKKVASYTVTFEPEVDGIDSDFHPGEQKQEWVPKLKKIVEETEQELFQLGGADGTLSDDEAADKAVLFEAYDKGKLVLSTGEITPQEVEKLVGLRKRLRGGYDGDGGTPQGWAHPEALASIVTEKFHEEEGEAADRRMELLKRNSSPDNPIPLSYDEEVTPPKRRTRSQEVDQAAGTSAAGANCGRFT